MKDQLYLFISICSLFNCLFAQKYTPLQFNNYTPLWTHLHDPDKIPIKEGNWIFREQNWDRDLSVTDDGVLFNVYNIVFGPAWIGGYYLEAIDLENGNLLWDRKYYSEEIGERRISERPEIHGDTLELLIREEFDKSDTFFKPIWLQASPRRLSFNKKNGDLLYSSFHIPKDPNGRRIPVTFPYAPSHLYYLDSNFIVINHLALTDTLTGQSSIWYNKIVLNPHSTEIGNYELYVKTKYNKLYNTLNDVNDKTLFGFYYTESHPDSTKKGIDIGFHYMDRQLKILMLGKLDILDTNRDNGFGTVFVSSDYFLISSLYRQDIPTYYYQFNYLTLFDRKGNNTERLDLRALKINSVNELGLSATVINMKNTVRILFCIQDPNKNILDFYLSNGAGQFAKINSLKYERGTKTEIHISTLEQIGNNLLCYFIYRENGTGLAEAPLWSSWAMLKGEDLGILTANKDISFDQKNILKISPNPTSEILTIEFDNVISGKLLIYNELGQLVFSTKIKNDKEFKYDASGLTKGNYTVQYITDNKVLKSHFIKTN
ncbi:MAG TPA: T9SS type A sorting domain-containing protein [Saprospiraceae bacterium]|nr:T9SS type A sorting domain-containing protein [Saprospiraceae bacterium]